MNKYPNLERKIWEKGLKKARIANTLGIAPKTFSNKLTGKTQLTWDEVCTIQRCFFPESTKESLFETAQ